MAAWQRGTPSPNPLRRRMYPQQRGLVKGTQKQSRLKHGPSDSIYQRWWWYLLKWLPLALAGAQAATSIGGTTTHSLHEAHEGGGTHPQLERGLAETRLTREEEERNPLTHAFGHFHISRHFLNQTLHTSFSFLGYKKSWSLFLDKREERLHCYECFWDTLHTLLYAAVFPRRLASYKLYQWAPLPSSCQLAWPIGGQVRDTKG